MIADVDVPQSDGWWLRKLSTQMNQRPLKRSPLLVDSRRDVFGRRDWMDLLWSYYTGEPPLPRLAREHAQATQEFLRMSRANYGRLSVVALLDRLSLHAVRTVAPGGADVDGDDTVRRIMDANGSWLADTLAFALGMGQGYVIVGQNDEDPSQPFITAEDPRQVIAALDPIRPDVARAALKTYRDDDLGEDVAHVYLPAGIDPVTGDRRGDRVRVAVRTAGAGPTRFAATSWEWDEDRSGEFAVQGFGVPVIPWTNELGLGEYEPHLDLLDRINNMIADRLWISKIQAFRQRAVKGDLPETDDSGQKIDYNSLFEADPGALWRLPNNVEMWESQQTDMSGALAAVRDDVKEFSAVSRTPLTMFTPDAAAGSAEGASLMREGLIFKSQDRQKRFTPPALRTARIALAYAGNEAAARGDLQAQWAPVERYTLEQRGSAAVQAKTSGVPQESILSEVWQFPPATVKRMLAQRGRDLLFSDDPAATAQEPEGGTPGG